MIVNSLLSTSTTLLAQDILNPDCRRKKSRAHHKITGTLCTINNSDGGLASTSSWIQYTAQDNKPELQAGKNRA